MRIVVQQRQTGAARLVSEVKREEYQLRFTLRSRKAFVRLERTQMAEFLLTGADQLEACGDARGSSAAGLGINRVIGR